MEDFNKMFKEHFADKISNVYEDPEDDIEQYPDMFLDILEDEVGDEDILDYIDPFRFE